MRSSKTTPPQQEPYDCAHYTPYFNVLLGDNTASGRTVSDSDYLETAANLKISRTAPRRNFVLKGSENVMNSSIEMFDPEVLLETFGKIASNIRRPASFSLPPIQVDLQGFGFGFDDPNESEHSSPRAHEENISQRTHGCVGNSIFNKTYLICRGESSLLRIHLPQSVALFYNGYAPLLEIEESCESIKMLDSYLKERKEDVTEGAPGRFLHVVLRQDICVEHCH